MEDTQRGWLFAEGSVLEECFDDALLSEANSAGILRVASEKLANIRKHPITPDPAMIHGEVVHIAKTGQFVSDDVTLPPLLIVYSLDHVRRLIHLIYICRAAESDTERSLDRAVQLITDRRREAGGK